MWTSGGAILRDLSRAQGDGGRGIHAELHALSPRDRPPPPLPRWPNEEMEEYVRGLAPALPVATAACEGRPDLRHIQQMLDMVRTLNIAEDEITNDEALIGELVSYAIERSRSTNLSAEVATAGPANTTPARVELAAAGPAHTPPAVGPALSSVHHLHDPNKYKKRRRNIALESILQTLENNERNDADAINSISEQITLLNPEDLIKEKKRKNNNSTGTDNKNAEDIENTSSYNKIESCEKVNQWMNQMLSPIQTKSQSKQVREAIRLDPSSMFKRKVKVDIAKPCTKLNSEAAFKNQKSPTNGAASYVPSADASLCYQRYLENNKQIQIRREEASQLAALITEALDRAAQVAATERAAQVEATERAAPEEAPERASQATSVCVDSSVTRALLTAPAGVRLTAPRPCLPLKPCLVCARLTRCHAPPPQPESEGRAAADPWP